MAAGGARNALLAARDRACRLRPDDDLVDVDAARAFLADRGMLTLTPCCSLPSLFGACRGDDPWRPERRGYARYPERRWWWGGALEAAPGMCWTKLHKGKGLYLTDAVAETVAPLCLAEVERAAAGGHGDDGQRLVALLQAAGPSLIDDAKRELGWDAKRLRSARGRLERVGAVVDRHVTFDTDDDGGHLHTAELRLWPWGTAGDPEAALDDLVVAAIRAAVVAPEREVRAWFSWPVDLDRLADLGRLSRVDGLLALP